MALQQVPTIPETITVHLGLPNQPGGKRNRAVSRLYQKCGLQRDLPHMARSRNSREYLRTDYLCAEPHI